MAGAREVVELSRQTGVFAMEAMWTRFQPAVVRLRELVADGAIGEVRSVQADLGVQREFDPADRLFALKLGGGALLDLGVYDMPTFFSSCFCYPFSFRFLQISILAILVNLLMKGLIAIETT